MFVSIVNILTMYSSKMLCSTNDDSIWFDANHRPRIISPDVANIAEFRIDDDQWSNWVMEVDCDSHSYILQQIMYLN